MSAVIAIAMSNLRRAKAYRAQAPALKSYAAARADFIRRGQSISEWARQHNVCRCLVYEILAGHRQCHRGHSHKVAVLLGIKAGEIVE